MKRTLTFCLIICTGLVLTGSVLFASTLNVPASYATIAAALSVAVDGDIINVQNGTYAENVVLNKAIVLNGQGTGTVIQPSSGIGIIVTVPGVTIQNLKVTGAPDHGIYAGGVANLTITNVTADGNGTGTSSLKSGIALQGVTGTSVLTDVTATNNKGHGLEIGNGSADVQVVRGTFTGNGTPGDATLTTGSGILVYASATKWTTGTIISGDLTASNNLVAGINLSCEPGGHIVSTRIGMNAGGTNIGGTVTLNDNGSTIGSNSGGAAVLVYGPCDDTKIRANSEKAVATSWNTSGLVVLGTNAAGDNSPTNTVIKDCNLKGFSASSPAGTMTVTYSGTTKICKNDVDATVGNSINTISPLTGYVVEDLLVHKVDDLSLGFFKGPGTELFVPASNGSINRGIAVANIGSYGITQINVQKNHVYLENVVLNTTVPLVGEDATNTTITPTSGIGINVTIAGATIKNLIVAGAADHGIYAGGVANLTIMNVTADANGTATKRSGIALQGVTGTSVLTNITATNNKGHGLEIGNGSTGVVQIDGGTFTGNGTLNDLTTGSGILVYADAGKVTNGTVIKGVLTASNNLVAGINLSCQTGGTLDATSIGATGTITLQNNGGTDTHGTGGAGILIYGPATNTSAKAAFVKGATSGAGAVIVSTDGDLASSPATTILTGSTFTGYTSSYPAITLATGIFGTSGRLIAKKDVVATGVTFTGATTNANIDAVIYDSKDPSESTVLGTVSYTPFAGLLVKVKVFLEGPYVGPTMSTALATANAIPLAQTFTGAPFTYAGIETAASTGFLQTNSIVDWVLVELRSSATGAAVDRRAALLKNDGTVRETDGTEGVTFSTASAGDYWVVVKHRNHLAVMSLAAVTLPNASAYDFTTSQGQAYGAGAPMKALAGPVYAMYAGEGYNNVDIFGDGQITSSDFDVWLPRARVAATGYEVTDFNLDGQVTSTDFDLWLPNARAAAATRVP